MSIGNGNQSRIYKTTNMGKTWSLQYSEQNPKAFLDCMAFWNAMNGIVVGDAVDGKAELLRRVPACHVSPPSVVRTPALRVGSGPTRRSAERDGAPTQSRGRQRPECHPPSNRGPRANQSLGCPSEVMRIFCRGLGASGFGRKLPTHGPRKFIGIKLFTGSDDERCREVISQPPQFQYGFHDAIATNYPDRKWNSARTSP